MIGQLQVLTACASLLTFLAVGIASIWRKRLLLIVFRIRSTDGRVRAELVENLLEAFQMDTIGLPPEVEVRLLQQQIERRIRDWSGAIWRMNCFGAFGLVVTVALFLSSSVTP